jgi:CRISPR-associated endonuclease Cas2
VRGEADRRCVIFCYDSPSGARRRRVARRLEGVGIRIQGSVFMARLSLAEARVVYDTVRAEMDPTFDDLLVLPVCARCEALVLHDGIGAGVTVSEDFFA